MKTLLARGLALVAFAMPGSVQAQNWSGFYAGVHVGGVWSTGEADVGCSDPTNLADCPVNLGPLTADDFSADASGFIGGGQIGYNFQTGNIVIGLEADISGTSLDGSDSETNPNPDGGNVENRFSQDLEWLGTVRGRLGWTSGNWLFYATGGLAYGQIDSRYSQLVTVFGNFANDSDSSTKTGWTAGGGAEVAFGQWSLKGEYLYYDLGEIDLSAQGRDAAGVPSGPLFFETDAEVQGHIGRIGLNYHFD